MPKLRVLSGAEVCAILQDQGFEQVRQSGSHVVMQKKLENTTVTAIVPLHKELAVGTLQSILRQSGLPREHFE